ncbi:MAG: hypothetical protein KKH41_00245 [Candidatus Thermoplasmatota archaeon]|nr:hypothetical protein [Candidatus Thermoplasmatota archaeon]MBU4072196.1 hypothetical protein [Candidatus Thermoplasmatota archaeon]MBU4144227.1 hypothetical protein [Candidatus Thermoplasmatota archaeon]MBU4590993.1 hypothetical protein [Candidatus Thermoplasmatota archaeon]
MNPIETEILKVARNGKIDCARALAIAKELKVPPRDVGKAIDGLGIRICNCQLGCFE